MSSSHCGSNLYFHAWFYPRLYPQLSPVAQLSAATLLFALLCSSFCSPLCLCPQLSVMVLPSALPMALPYGSTHISPLWFFPLISPLTLPSSLHYDSTLSSSLWLNPRLNPMTLHSSLPYLPKFISPMYLCLHFPWRSHPYLLPLNLPLSLFFSHVVLPSSLLWLHAHLLPMTTRCPPLIYSKLSKCPSSTAHIISHIDCTLALFLALTDSYFRGVDRIST